MISDIYDSFETSSFMQPGIAGPEVTDAFGKKTKNVAPKWDFFFAKLASIYRQTYTAFFKGGISKINSNPWKWDSLDYTRQDKTDGSNPPCIELVVNMTSTNINFINSNTAAQVELSWTAQAIIKCFNDAQHGPTQYHEVTAELLASSYQ